MLGSRFARLVVVPVAGALALAGAVLAAPPAGATAPTTIPVLLSPSDGATVATTPVFTWGAATGATKYRIQVSTNAGFASVAYTLDTLNLNATPLTELPTGPLFWRVAATDGASGVGTYSDSRMLTVSGIGAPTPLAPDDGQVFDYPTGTPVLQWAPMAGVKSYKVEIDDESAFIGATVVATPNTAVAVTSSLILSKPYYWRVSAVTASNAQTATSDTRSFQVRWPDLGGKPVLLSPADSVVDTVSDVVLRWAPVDGATKYQLQVNSNPNFTNNATDDKTVFGTQYSPANTYANGAYYWRVRALDPVSGRQGPWSDSRAFRRATPAPDAPVLDLPADLATTSQWAFQWEPVPTGSTYEVQWDADGNFGTGAYGCTTYHTRWAALGSRPSQPSGSMGVPAGSVAPVSASCSAPAKSGTWHWRVRAIDEPTGQGGPFSESRTITYTLPAVATGTPDHATWDTYVTPENCEAPACTAKLPDSPELSWNPVPNADHYIVYVALDKKFTNEVQRYDVPGTHFTPREIIPDNATGASYYWWLQPCAADRCPTNSQSDMEGTAHAFQKLAAPVVPVSPLTTDDATLTDVVTLEWQATYETQPAAAGAKLYHVQVANDSGFNSVVDEATVDQTTYQAVTKTYPDGTYYWRVQVVDGAGTTLSWSPSQSFAKTSTRPTGLTASRLDPASAVPLLSWDSTSYTSGYMVEIYSGTSDLFPSANLKKTVTVKLPVYTPDVAFPAGEYSWRVRRLDPSTNPGSWQTQDTGGSVPVFTVSAPTAPLLAPDDGTAVTGNNLLFRWAPVAGATSYIVESSTVDTFATTIERVTTALTSWAPSIAYPDGVTVYWRVRAIDSLSQVLSTSESRTLTKDAKAPTATVAITGATTSLRPSATITFSEDVTGVSPASVVLRRVGGAAIATAAVCADAGGAATACGGTVRRVVLTPTALVVPGERYEVAVTAGVADAFGNAFAASTVAFRALLTVEQNSGSPRFGSGWVTVASATASGRSYARSATKGAYVTWSNRGVSLKVTYVTGSNFGKLGVYVDGALKATLDQYAATSTKKVLSIALTDKVHTVKLVVLGTKNATSKGTYVTLDALGTS